MKKREEAGGLRRENNAENGREMKRERLDRQGFNVKKSKSKRGEREKYRGIKEEMRD